MKISEAGIVVDSMGRSMQDAQFVVAAFPGVSDLGTAPLVGLAVLGVSALVYRAVVYSKIQYITASLLVILFTDLKSVILTLHIRMNRCQTLISKGRKELQWPLTSQALAVLISLLEQDSSLLRY